MGKVANPGRDRYKSGLAVAGLPLARAGAAGAARDARDAPRCAVADALMGTITSAQPVMPSGRPSDAQRLNGNKPIIKMV